MHRRFHAKATIALFCGGALSIFAWSGDAEAASVKTLYVFEGGTDGDSPAAGLTADAQGNLYGTTEYGGSQSACSGGGCGTVFKLASDDTESVLYAFTGTNGDGFWPAGGLLRDKAGNLYGTTLYGGIKGHCKYSCGTVFSLTPDGVETVIHAFNGGKDGWAPAAGLIADSKGNFYGTTQSGGAKDLGTVFRISRNGTEKVLYAFKGGSDGANPEASLLLDKAGNLYGTTAIGGTCSNAGGCGTVFRLAPDGTETVLYTFTDGTDGGYPASSLIADKAGNLYGTTEGGGIPGIKSCDRSTCGVVFSLAPDRTETVLYSFHGGMNDGGEPHAGVVADTAGNLYGTTYRGGGNKCGGQGCGTVYKLAPDGTESVLAALAISDKANAPTAGLIIGANGRLYGTASLGGGPKNVDCCGSVFMVKR